MIPITQGNQTPSATNRVSSAVAWLCMVMPCASLSWKWARLPQADRQQGLSKVLGSRCSAGDARGNRIARLLSNKDMKGQQTPEALGPRIPIPPLTVSVALLCPHCPPPPHPPPPPPPLLGKKDFVISKIYNFKLLFFWRCNFC